jgi:anti-sigma factor (TIGR02949 family)
MDGERTVAGLSCSEVLEKLDAFLDGTIDGATRDAIALHVGGCDRCAKFGDAYTAVAKRVRTVTGDEAPDGGVLERLRERLRRALDR